MAQGPATCQAPWRARHDVWIRCHGAGEYKFGTECPCYGGEFAGGIEE